MRTSHLVLLVALVGVLGVVFGRHTAPAGVTDTSRLDRIERALAHAQARAQAGPAPHRPTVELARLEERVVAAIAASDRSRAEPVADPEPSPASLQAGADAEQLVATAAAGGRWGRMERDRMRELLPQMSAQQQEEALAAFSAAINAGRIVPDLVPSL